MKKLVLTTTFFIAAFISMNAQTRITAELKAFLRNNGYKISTEQHAYLKEGHTAYHRKTFYSGTQYAIIAYSEDYGVYDIDVALYDTDGSLLVKDIKSDALAIVEYAPYFTRAMKVVIKNYNSATSYKDYYCQIIIAYR